MPDTLVFRPKKIGLLLLLEQGILLFFSLLIIFGNLLRPAFLPSNSSPEMALDILSFVYLLSSSRSRAIWIALSLVAASTLYGICINSWDTLSVLHGIKLFGMVCSGVAVGKILFSRYGNDIKRCLHFFMKSYFLCFLIGGILFILFPVSTKLYQFMAKYSLSYMGDPHIGRLISPYLDPNYFAAIACLPLLLTPYVKRMRISIFVISLCILLSWSRSGIATAALMMIPLFFSLPSKKKRQLVTALVLVSLPLFFFEELHIFIDRLLSFQKDPSALARGESFQWGVAFLKEHPLFGVGYNFVNSEALKESALYSLDSSLLLTLNSFGTLPTLLFLFCGGVWIHNHFAALRKQKSPILHTLSRSLIFYIATIFLFTSLFNNILFYQYWLIPTLALVVYCNECAQYRTDS